MNAVRKLFQADIDMYQRKMDVASKAYIDYNDKDMLETYHKLGDEMCLLKDTILRIEEEFGELLCLLAQE